MKPYGGCREPVHMVVWWLRQATIEPTTQPVSWLAQQKVTTGVRSELGCALNEAHEGIPRNISNVSQAAGNRESHDAEKYHTPTTGGNLFFQERPRQGCPKCGELCILSADSARLRDVSYSVSRTLAHLFPEDFI